MTSLEMANFICGIIEEKKGTDIVKIEVSKISTLCDYFILASGSSTTNVKAIAEGIEEKLEEKEIFVKRMDGLSEGRWVAMDYGDIIVHIFNDETRLFYHIEKIWEKGDVSRFMTLAEKEAEKKAKEDKKIKEAKEAEKAAKAALKAAEKIKTEKKPAEKEKKPKEVKEKPIKEKVKK